MLNSFQHLIASLYLPPSLGEILKQVQDDFGRFLLFLHSFWGSQFNTSVKRSHNSSLTTHRSKFLKQAWYFAHLIVPLHKKGMRNDVFESISQRGSGAEDTENRRIQEIADELQRRCCLYETKLRAGEKHVRPTEIEVYVAEEYAHEKKLWTSINDVFNLGIPGPSGNENDTYVANDTIFKVNNLLNSQGSIIQLFHKILLHNLLFTETSYSFHSFTGFPGSSVMPIFKQSLIKDSTPATAIEIGTYMAALGFFGTNTNGRFTNGEFDVWDLLPRNVLKDSEGDIFVIDAEIKLL